MPTWSSSPTASRRAWRSVPLRWRASAESASANSALISCWPFPEQHIRELAAATKAFVVPELNLGQMVQEVERAAAGKAKTIPVTHAGGSVHSPDDILRAIVEAAR